MAIGIDELFEMLDCNNDEETQKIGIEEGIKVKNWLIFVRPIENKNIWENCAKIIIQNSDEQTVIYTMLDWLQNSKWSGYNIIYKKIKSMPLNLIKNAYVYKIKEAKKQNNQLWLKNLSNLSKDKNLYEILTDKEKRIVNKFF